MINFFKFLDKFFGTPLAYFWGLFVNPKEPPKNPEKILVVKLIAMGDILVSMPTVKALRDKYPEAEIVYLTTPQMIPLLENWEVIDGIIELDPKNPMRLLNTILFIKNQNFDVAIELTHYYRLVSFVTFLAKIPHRIGFDLSGQGRNTLLTKGVPYDNDLHEVENFAELAKPLGAKLKDKKLVEPKLELAEDEKARIDESTKGKTITIHPGTSATAKSRRLAPEKFAKVADQLGKQGYQIIFSGAEEEKPIVEQIQKYSQKNHKSLVNKTSLGGLKYLFKRSKGVISLDTGPMHLSASTDTPTLGIFGANHPKKWGPYGNKHRAIYHGPETPCTRQQYGKVCTHPEAFHTQDIHPQEIIKTFNQMLD